MPEASGRSPILKAVPDCSISYDETFCCEVPSFLGASKDSAEGVLIRYLTLLPSFNVISRTVAFPSSVGRVCSGANWVVSVICFAVYKYSQMKEPVMAAISNQDIGQPFSVWSQHDSSANQKSDGKLQRLRPLFLQDLPLLKWEAG